MKQSKLQFSLTLCLIGFSICSFAQITLPEVKIVASTYKYLNAVDNTEMAQPVRMLELKAATYDIKQSEFYEEDYDSYSVSFYIPNGYILASYDKEGKLISTAEKFKNTKVPAAVREAVNNKYPQWIIAEDIYLVNYHEKRGVNKLFKLVLENGSKRLKVKLNEKGEFL